MDKGIYTALSGGLAKTHELELVSNNLANANTPGFKRDTGTFHEYLSELRKGDTVEGLKREIQAASDLDARPQGDKSFVEMDGVYTDFRQGALMQTHRFLDCALEGKGFFEVLTPVGVRFTRQGNFSVNSDGFLVTANGFPVLSRGRDLAAAKNSLFAMADQTTRQKANKAAPPEIEPEKRQIRLRPGGIEISPDGTIYQDNNKIAMLSVIEFKELQLLEKTGNAYFRNTHPENAINDFLGSQVHQKYLETSNVNPVQEMTKLIEVSRAYESHMQAIKTYQEVDQRSVMDIAGGR